MLMMPSWMYFTEPVPRVWFATEEHRNGLMIGWINGLAHRAGFVYSKVPVTRVTGGDERREAVGLFLHVSVVTVPLKSINVDYG